MYSTFRNMPVETVAKSTAVVFTAAFMTALIGVGTAAADEFSKVTGNITGKVPLKIIILNDKSVEIGRTSDYQLGSFSIPLREQGKDAKVGRYRWEAFAKGDAGPCDKDRDVTTSSIPAVPRAHACEPKAAAAGAPGAAQGGGQAGVETIGVTINNQSDVPVTVKFTDAANGEFTTFVKEKSSQSAGRVKIDKSKPIQWEATYNSKQCAVGTVSETINVTKCGPQLRQGDGGGCSLNDIGKDGCPSRVVLEQRKLREDKTSQLRAAEAALKSSVDAARTATTKAAAETALRQADQARTRIATLKRDLGELQQQQPAERINYTSELPKEYQDKNPFDLAYDRISRTVCRGGKVGWDGSILSCQKGDTPDPGDRPIAPATDISPNNPNAGR
jgi:hypothetical protein